MPLRRVFTIISKCLTVEIAFMSTYFLYRHIRHDKNEPFYIGIGTLNHNGKTEQRKFRRAFEITTGRNRHWVNIINITSYDVEIIFQSNNRSLILKKEREFIKLYGRKDLNKGSLVNFTNGGDGPQNQICTKEMRQKMSQNNFWKNKKGSKHFLSKKIYAYKITGEFVGEYGSYREASRILNISRRNINFILKKECQQCFGLTFYETFQGDQIKPIQRINRKLRKVACYDELNNKIKSFNSITEAGHYVNSQTTNISHACEKFTRICKGYHWKYED